MDGAQAQNDLALELRDLTERARAMNAFVFDATGLVWCSGWRPHGEGLDHLFAHVKAILESLEPPLQRGGKLDDLVLGEHRPMYCSSFAGMYVLGVWFETDTNLFVARRMIRDALPKIEAMTLSLPPPDGSDPSSGAQRGRA